MTVYELSCFRNLLHSRVFQTIPNVVGGLVLPRNMLERLGLFDSASLRFNSVI